MIIAVFLALAAIGYLGHDKRLLMVSGLGVLVYGFAYFSTSFYYSVVIVLAGAFIFIRAFTHKGMA